MLYLFNVKRQNRFQNEVQYENEDCQLNYVSDVFYRKSKRHKQFLLQSQKKSKRGQGLTEYLIIVALIAVSSIAVIRVTSKNLRAGFGEVANAIGGQTSNNLKKEDVSPKILEKHDLSNFNHQATQ